MLNKRIGDISFEDVVAFCADQPPEGIRLEYKQDFSPSNAGRAIAKLVCAFANTYGGLAIWGVEEAANRLPVAHPPGMKLGPNADDRIKGAIEQLVVPPMSVEVSGFLTSPSDPHLGFVVVRVPPGMDVPYTVGGRDVYVRVHDKSEPQHPSPEEFERLVLRRRTGVDVQTRRRERAIELLRAALGLPATMQAKHGKLWGNLWIAVGPRVSPGPFCSPRQLIERARAYSVQSQSDQYPFGRYAEPRSIQDGLYCVENGERYGALVDIFGNLVIFSNVYEACTVRHDHGKQFADALQQATNPAQQVGVHLPQIIDRLYAAVRSSQRLLDGFGAIGDVDLCATVSGIRNRALVGVASHAGMRVLGVTRAEDSISATTSSSAAEYTSEGCVRAVVANLLWNWGCHDVRAIDPAMREGERFHFGTDLCPRCKSQQKLVNREFCQFCDADVLTEGNAC